MAREKLYAEHFGGWGAREEPRSEYCLQVFRRLRGDRLLDIGCGDGAVTVLLAKAMGATEAHGVDIAPGAVMLAKQNGVQAVCLDLDRDALPFPDGWFDAIYCGEIIEHVFDTDHLLEEVRRVLKEGGHCVLSTPNLAGWANRFALLLGFQPYAMAASPKYEQVGKFILGRDRRQGGHLRVLTLRALKELVKLHSLSIISVKGCPVNIALDNGLGRIVSCLDRVLARFPGLANRTVLVLRKG